jgi:head-tail adaptor
VNAGVYRESITIQRLVQGGKNPNGFREEDTWEDYYTNYAYVNKLSGTERWTAAQVQMDSVVRFTMRWHPFLDEVTPKRYRLMFGSRVFTITNVDNVQFRNETVKIDGVEVMS